MNDETNASPAAVESGQPPESEPVSYSQQQLEERIAQAVAEASKGFDERIAAERADAEKLARLSEKERAEEEQRRSREQFEAEKAEFAKQQRHAYAKEQLTAANLPTSFAEQVCGIDDETTKANVAAFGKAFSEAVAAAVDAKLKSNPPKHGTTPPDPKSEMASIIAASMKRGF